MKPQTLVIESMWQWTPYTPQTIVTSIVHYPEPFAPTLPGDPACPDVQLTIIVQRWLSEAESQALDEAMRECAARAIEQQAGVHVPDGHAVNILSEIFHIRVFA